MHFAQFLTGLQLMVFFSCHETKWSALFKYCVMICCFRNWLQLDECRTNLIFVSTDGTQQLHCPKWVHCESSRSYSLLRCSLRKHFGVFIFRLAAASCRNEIEDICSLLYFCKISITVNYFNKQYTQMKFQCMFEIIDIQTREEQKSDGPSKWCKSWSIFSRNLFLDWFFGRCCFICCWHS